MSSIGNVAEASSYSNADKDTSCINADKDTSCSNAVSLFIHPGLFPALFLYQDNHQKLKNLGPFTDDNATEWNELFSEQLRLEKLLDDLY